jgi:hypothetical protein
MPFQVSLCGAYTIVSPVTIDIMSTFMSPCVSSLTLTATVVSGHTRGHRFLWELAEGSQVVFTSPVDQLVVTCDLTDKTDRTFYFWIDKGKLTQVRQIFHFIGTPTDLMETTGGAAIIYSTQDVLNSTISCASIIGTQSCTLVNPSGTGVVNPNTPVLFWTLPTGIGLQSVEVQQDINGNWTTILSILPTDPQILTTATMGAYYRIVTNYTLEGHYYKQYSCPYPLLIDFSNYNAYITELIYGGGNISPTSPIQVNYTLLTTDSVTNELYDIISISGGNISPYSTSQVNYTLLSTDSVTDELYDTVVQFGANISPFTISATYFGGTVIGSSV